MTTFEEATASADARTQQLEAEVADLRGVVDRLTAVVERLTAPSQPDPEPSDGQTPAVGAEAEPTSSRRGLLRLAGVAAAGAVAASVTGATPAAADDGIALIPGTATSTANITRITYTGGSSSSAFTFQSWENGHVGSLAGAALAGLANSTGPRDGVFGHASTTQFNAVGVRGIRTGGVGYGVYGLCNDVDSAGVGGGSQSGTGVAGVSQAGTGTSGTSQEGVGTSGTSESNTGVSGTSTSSTGVSGTSTSGTGVEAVSTEGTGLTVIGNAFAVQAATTSTSGVAGWLVGGSQPGGFGLIGSGDYGLAAALTSRANLWLAPNNSFFGSSPKTPPRQRIDAHQVGEMECVDGDLWWCVAAGTPGTWRRISGPSTAGAFVAISPTRVYDSRSAQPSPGPLAVGGTRNISVKDGRNLDTGAVTVPNVVPPASTAILANVSVVNTRGNGYLTANPVGNLVVSAATINWSAADQVLNNGVSLTLGGDRQLTVICGGIPGTQTDFVIDITGYFS